MPYHYEALESRLLLTATAAQHGKTLVVTGDGADDVVAFVATDEVGTVSVILAEGGDPITFTGVKNIKVDLKGGDDFLLFDELGFEVAGKITVKTGAGDDEVNFRNFADITCKKLVIDLGDGNDSSFGNVFAVHGDLIVKGGNGQDEVIYGLNVDVQLDGRVNINLGSGNDSLLLLGTVGAKSKANGGSGQDLFDVSQDATIKLKNFEEPLV